MSAPFNGLTPAEAERLALLAEECGEVIQAVAKVLRHGYESTHPDKPEAGTNRDMLQRELADLRAAESLMIEAGDVYDSAIVAAALHKIARVQRYLHEQPAHAFTGAV